MVVSSHLEAGPAFWQGRHLRLQELQFHPLSVESGQSSVTLPVRSLGVRSLLQQPRMVAAVPAAPRELLWTPVEIVLINSGVPSKKGVDEEVSRPLN